MWGKLANVLLFLLMNSKTIVTSVENAVTGAKQGATKKAIATSVLMDAATVLHGGDLGAHTAMIQAVTNVAIEDAVQIMNAGSAPAPAPVVVLQAPIPFAPLAPVAAAPAPVSVEVAAAPALVHFEQE